MKTLIIYCSKTGYTKKYATWLKQSLNADITSVFDLDILPLSNYELIVYGGSLYATGILGWERIKEAVLENKNIKVIVFATGVAPYTPAVEEELRDGNFTPDEQKRIRFYYLRGGFDYKHLPIKEKIMMTLLKWKIMIKKKEKRTKDEIGMLAVYHRPVDYTKESNIEPMVEYIRSLEKKGD